MADAYGIAYSLVTDRAALDGEVARMLATPGPYLLECAIKEEDNVLPMTPPGKSVDEMLLEINDEIWKERNCIHCWSTPKTLPVYLTR